MIKTQLIRDPAAVSMLGYLKKKGIDIMSGICKYPESVCPHMTVLKGKTYCDATPCQLTGELPEQTNADHIRGMNDEELANLLSECTDCATCKLTNHENCKTEEACKTAFLNWLKHPAEEVGWER